MSFSCLISSFEKDNPDQLFKCLNSLVGQTLPADEIVFVKDGLLTDELEKILFEFETKLPFVFISLQVNKGLGNALNLGLKSCSNEIVMRMDIDDICYSDRFEIQYKYLKENPKIDIVGGWAHDINSKDEVIGERKYPVKHYDIFRLIWASPIIHPTVAFRKSKIISIGSYNTEIGRRQDYELWIRSADEGLVFANMPKYLIQYRVSENYYNKNNSKVAFDQALMGLRGARKLELPKYVYLAVFIPFFRSLVPGFIIKYIHKWMSKFDPRKV